jgi:hypothetical protein
MTEQNYRIRIKLGEVEIEAEGDKDFVEKHIEEFKKEMPRIARELPSKEVTPEIPREKIELEKLSLAEFYKQKKPKEDMEVAITIAYYLTASEKREEFTNQEIKENASRLGYKLTNVSDTLRRAASGKKAYVNKVTTGKWALTVEGKSFVERELPRKIEK